MSEIWKSIPGYGGYYEASSEGRIRSIERTVIGYSARGKRPIRIHRKSHLMKLDTRHGYKCLCLYFDGKEKKEQVHSLILKAFVGERPSGYHACHNNGIRFDNRIENLRWDTPASNQADIQKHGNRPVGSLVGTAVITETEALKIKNKTIGPSEACRIFGISRTQFYRIKNGEAWKHLNGVAA